MIIILKQIFQKHNTIHKAIEKLNNLSVIPLKELVDYCKKLYLDNVLEQLDLLYNLGLNKRYSEVYTNYRK